MKEKGLLVKYFTTLSRDNGGLLLNCTWLDPWVTAKMLRLLFALAIKIIVAGALALEAAAAAQSMLRQSQEEAEVQDAVEDEQEKRDVERAAQRKEKNRIPKKMKKVLTEEEEKEAHAPFPCNIHPAFRTGYTPPRFLPVAFIRLNMLINQSSRLSTETSSVSSSESPSDPTCTRCTRCTSSMSSCNNTTFSPLP